MTAAAFYFWVCIALGASLASGSWHMGKYCIPNLYPLATALEGIPKCSNAAVRVWLGE